MVENRLSEVYFQFQNPADGYFRVPKVGPIDFTDLIGVIGTVEECNCNQHSGICDPETGICQVLHFIPENF